MSKAIEKDRSIDIIRIFALFLVILVHTHVGYLGVESFESSFELFLFFLGKLGVPLFVMISGALLLPKTDALYDFYKKRIKKILLPWIFWAIMLLLSKISGQLVPASSFLAIFQQFLIVLLSDFWFMPMIVGLYFLTPFIRAFITAKTPILPLLVIWLVITSVLPAIYLSPLFPGSSSAGLLTIIISFAGYFMLGWYVKKYFIRISSHLLVTLFTISVVSYGLGTYIYRSVPNALFFVLHDYFSPAILGGSVSLFILLLKKIPRYIPSIPSHILSTLSSNSYGIFLSHTLIILLTTAALPGIFADQGIFLWLIRAVLVYSISTMLITTLTRFTKIKNIFT